MKKILLIIDIDNTIAENEQREHLLPDWTAFFKACDTDTPILPMLSAIKPYLNHKDIDCVFVTGRVAHEEVIVKTKQWLTAHLIDNAQVKYRPLRNYKKAPVFKQSVLDSMHKNHHSVVILDDDVSIIHHFNALGHTGVLVEKENDYLNTINKLSTTVDSLVLKINEKNDKCNHMKIGG